MSHQDFTDDQLMARVVAEDLDAFQELVRRYQDRLVTHGTRFLGDRSRAEDIAQETFLRVYRARNSYDPQAGARFSTWLYTICMNLIRSEGRRAFWRRRQELPEGLETDSSSDPSQVVEVLDLKQAVSEAVELLKPHERLVFVLRDIDGLTYEEIAEVINCPLGTVKSRVNRARHAFKKAYTSLHGVP